MDETRTTRLLGDLCTELGFFLPQEKPSNLIANPQGDAIAFTEAVITAEGPELDSVERHLYRQIRDRVRAALDEG